MSDGPGGDSSEVEIFEDACARTDDDACEEDVTAEQETEQGEENERGLGADAWNDGARVEVWQRGG